MEAKQLTDQLGQYKEWADIGKGVGYAVRESLTAVKDVAIDFSKTDIGKFTMFLVAWKIMAKDLLSMGDMVVGYLVGVPTLVFGLLIITWSYRKQCVARSVLVEKGPGFWIWRSKKYEIYDPANRNIEGGDGKITQEMWVWAHSLAAFILIIICCLMIFAGN